MRVKEISKFSLHLKCGKIFKRYGVHTQALAYISMSGKPTHFDLMLTVTLDFPSASYGFALLTLYNLLMPYSDTTESFIRSQNQRKLLPS